MGKLDGKVALITGAARGMGEAITRMFIAEGASVLIADILSDAGKVLEAELGHQACYCYLDVRDADSWSTVVETALQRFGKLDILVNNAGILEWQLIEDMTLDTYSSVIDVNQVGCWLGMKTVLPALKMTGSGAIVNMSSLAGRTGMDRGSAYAASKHAILGMTKCAAIEFGPYNIRVNAVLPGAIDTQMTGRRPKENGNDNETSHQKLPLGRIGRVDEVARLVIYLASDESGYCTGAEFLIDGGMSLKVI